MMTLARSTEILDHRIEDLDRLIEAYNHDLAESNKEVGNIVRELSAAREERRKLKQAVLRMQRQEEST